MLVAVMALGFQAAAYEKPKDDSNSTTNTTNTPHFLAIGSGNETSADSNVVTYEKVLQNGVGTSNNDTPH